VPCPPEADAAYTCTTRAILNLFMCYEALENFQWTQADVFYGRATSEWVLATYNLQSAGLMKRAV